MPQKIQPQCSDEQELRPKLDATGDLHEATSAVLRYLSQANDPPGVFKRGGHLVRLTHDEQNTLSTQNLNPHSLRGLLAEHIRFVSSENEIGMPPPMAVVHNILAASELPFPMLSRVVEVPIFGPNGSSQMKPGYDQENCVYYHPPKGLSIPLVSSKPSPGQLQEAKDFLVAQLLGDFPFSSAVDLANTVGAIILPHVKELISGNTPLHMIEAPTPGTGKSLLADIIVLPSTGRVAPAMIEASSNAEWRKRITAMLLEAPTFVLIDNIRRPLDSSALAGVLTTKTFADRILGRSEMRHLPVNCIWLATGNNPRLTTELARRTVRIRLNSTVDRPWLRTGFRHKDLRGFVLDNRGRILWCILTLIQAWIANGRPPGGQILGNYERWAETIGGILANAGVDGFLDNAMDMYDEVDEEMNMWHQFLSEWWERHQDYPVGVRDLYRVAKAIDLPILGHGNEGSQRSRLGQNLRQNRDRKIGDFVIVKSASCGPGQTSLYKLEVCKVN